MLHQRLTARELLAINEITPDGLRSLRRRGNIALLGGDNIIATKMHLPIDAVALMLSSALARTYQATTAASLVRAFANVLLVVVAEAEAEAGVGAASAVGTGNSTETPISVVEFRDADDRRAFVVCGGDAMSELAKSPAAHGYRLEAITTINVTGIIAKVRDRAMRLGLNLSQPFLPAPDSIEFGELMQLYDPATWGVFVEEKALKKRDRAARKAGEQARMIAMGGRVSEAISGRRDEV